MAEHILDIIKAVRKQNQSVNALTSMGLLAYYQAGVDLAMWAYQLDLRDLTYIETCGTWDDLVQVLTCMEHKYRALWELVGKPADAETWQNLAQRGKVGYEYWSILNTEVVYHYQLRQQEVAL